MDQEAYDILVRKQQKIKKVPGKRLTAGMSQFVPKVDAPTDPLPPPWHHIPQLTTASNLTELKKQRDQYGQHAADMVAEQHNMHAEHVSGALPLGHGKYLLEFPGVIDTLHYAHKMRGNQATAAEHYGKTKIMKVYGKYMGYQPIGSPSPSKTQAKKKDNVELVQLLVDEMGLDPDDLLTELAATV